MEFRIKKGSVSDLSSAYRLIKELADFENCQSELVLTEEQFIADGSRTPSPFQFFLISENQKCIGLALFFDYYSTWKGRSLYLEDLIIDGEYRGMGWGKLLLKEVGNYAFQNNYQNIFWQVLNHNDHAKRFYQHLGAITDNSWSNCRWTRETFEKFLVS